MKRPEGEDGFNSMDRISDLPKDILQRILYFLSQEDAVRTSVLSKSWRNIWCTRPNLDFSIYAFKENKQEFLTAVDNTLQLYCDQSLCVEEFRLSILLDHDFYEESISLLEKWIPLLTNMGTKEFRLWIGTQSYPGDMHLPPVVFEAESLKDLRVRGFMLDQKAIRRIQLLKNLRILRLKQVFIKDDDINCTVKIHPPSLETVDSGEWNIPLLKRGAEFCNLTSLSLTGVYSSLDYLSSCKFPSLTLLTLSECWGLEGVEIFIDAPRINYFEYRGHFIPSISFATTTSGKWRSLIDLVCVHSDDDSSLWLLQLNELLESLSQSKISLNVNHVYNIAVRDDNGCGNKPVVVDGLGLGFYSYSISSSFMNAMFCVCRPGIIYDSLDCGYGWEMNHIECLWEILMQRECGDGDDRFRKLWKRDLEEVRLEIHDKYRNEWRPITLFDLRNWRLTEQIPARFALKWRQTL
ncbi:hypothetical protein ACP275_05G051700 [Erythranthe tilingii]